MYQLSFFSERPSENARIFVVVVVGRPIFNSGLLNKPHVGLLQKYGTLISSYRILKLALACEKDIFYNDVYR